MNKNTSFAASGAPLVLLALIVLFGTANLRAQEAYRSIRWQDDFALCETKLREEGMSIKDTKEFNVKPFIDKYCKCSDLEKALINESFRGIALEGESEQQNAELFFIYEKPFQNKKEKIETKLWELRVAFSPDIAPEQILDKLKAAYGAPKESQSQYEFPVLLKQLDVVQVTLGYLGFKFVAPVNVYTFVKDDVDVRFEVPDYKQVSLLVSDVEETKRINAEIFARFPNRSDKARSSINMAIIKTKEKILPICEEMAKHLRAGKELTPRMREVEAKMVEGKIKRPNLLVKINQDVTGKLESWAEKARKEQEVKPEEPIEF